MPIFMNMYMYMKLIMIQISQLACDLIKADISSWNLDFFNFKNKS